ncbi:SAVED domain-containing protein [Mesorhizobium sp. M0757]|uniref:SAVED domain-containing protein n=1 Tax=Mesorhizobium sp. M0757 TaxID=2956993 RepID=UPI00333CDA09
MADAVIANWDGHDYQARYFWIHASGLRDPEQHFVVEVSYEADGPKGFDDVVVRYSPGKSGRRSFAVEVAHHQVKFHVSQKGRFGYKELTNPDFIHATRFSILERLKEAVEKAPRNSTFTLVTTDRIRDDDDLRKLITSKDRSINVEILFDGTTDRSWTGKMRKCWREHLKLSSDEELKRIVNAFHIVEGHRSLEEMRDEVNFHFRGVGLKAGGNTLEFRFDGVARALKATQRNKLSREDFELLCQEQNWIRAGEDRRNVAIRSFGDGPTDYLLAAPENHLSLLDHFDERLLRPGNDWSETIMPEVRTFLERVRQTTKDIRLHLDTHASVAFLAGSLLGMKSGTGVEVMQKGRRGTSVWRSDDKLTGPSMTVTCQDIKAGKDVAVAISLSRDALADVEEYVSTSLGNVGKILHFAAANGVGPGSVAGGTHAAGMADQVSDVLVALSLRGGARAHIFVSAPNAFSFFLGQHRDAIGPVTVYEFDFTGSKTYHPSFRIG